METNRTRFNKCCLPQCESLRFSVVHKFPRKKARQRLWLDALPKMLSLALPLDKLTKSNLCSRHFRPQDYVFAGARSLNMVAVPSLNLVDLSQLDKCRQAETMEVLDQLEADKVEVVAVVQPKVQIENGKRSFEEPVEGGVTKLAKFSEVTELSQGYQYNSIADLEQELFGADDEEEVFEVESSPEDVESLPDELEELNRISEHKDCKIISNSRMEITYPGDANDALESIQVEVVWLRIQCQCSKCFDIERNLSKIAIFDLPTNLQLEMAVQKESPHELLVDWSDGHQSTYNLSKLINLHHSTNRVPNPNGLLNFWSKLLSPPDDFNTLKYNDLICSTDSVFSALERLKRVGVLIIQMPHDAQTDPLQQAILSELLVRRLFPHLPSSVQREKRSDFAAKYTPHTNCSFDSLDCGLQVLSVSPHAPKVSLALVDGFNAAAQLNSQTYRALSELLVSNVYTNSSGLEYTASSPLITLEAGGGGGRTNVVQRINCAPYNLSPAMAQEHFLIALREYTDLLRDPGQQWNLSLSPDMLLILDNWRICWSVSSDAASPTLDCIYVARKHYISRLHNLQKLARDGNETRRNNTIIAQFACAPEILNLLLRKITYRNQE